MLRGQFQVSVVQIASKEQFSAQLEIAERSSCSGRALGAAGTLPYHRAGMELDARSNFWSVLSDVFSWHGHVHICVCAHISACAYLCTVYVYGVYTFIHIYALCIHVHMYICTVGPCLCGMHVCSACMFVPRYTGQCLHVWHMYLWLSLGQGLVIIFSLVGHW